MNEYLAIHLAATRNRDLQRFAAHRRLVTRLRRHRTRCGARLAGSVKNPAGTAKTPTTPRPHDAVAAR